MGVSSPRRVFGAWPGIGQSSAIAVKASFALRLERRQLIGDGWVQVMSSSPKVTTKNGFR